MQKAHPFNAAYMAITITAVVGILLRVCMGEPGNAFDGFTTKTVPKNGSTVGHLPKDILRITKFYLDRSASMYLELALSNYRYKGV